MVVFAWGAVTVFDGLTAAVPGAKSWTGDSTPCGPSAVMPCWPYSDGAFGEVAVSIPKDRAEWLQSAEGAWFDPMPMLRQLAAAASGAGWPMTGIYVVNFALAEEVGDPHGGFLTCRLKMNLITEV